MTEDGVDDPAAALIVVEAGHWSGSASHFPEASLDDIRCADLSAVRLGAGKEAQQSLKVLTQAGDTSCQRPL